jgi:hypothetical protein
MLLLPCGFLLSVWQVDPLPVLREDALIGKVGPWAFTLAELDANAPKQGKSGAVQKVFALRFAEAAFLQIRAAYLRARQPRSLKAAGIPLRSDRNMSRGLSFQGNRLHMARILIPPEEQLWLTVEGWNGEIHQTAMEIARVSPALARFLAGKEAAQPDDESWDPTLACWHEAVEIFCQGTRFDDDSGQDMEDMLIEVSGEHGELLLSTRLNRKGQIRFPRPAGEFRVLLQEYQRLRRMTEITARDVEAKP